MIKKSLLVTLADKNYLEYAKQVFAGAYFNAGWQGDYMLLAHDIPEIKLKWFRQKGILIKHCKPLFKKKMMGLMPAVYSSKFCVFQTSFKKWSHIIYLDTDIIIRTSLKYLTEVKGFASVESTYSTRFKSEFKNYKDILNINPMAKTFSAGFFVFNTDIIDQKTFNHLVKLAKKYEKFSTTGDQAIFNLFFYSRWEKLPLVYDVYTTEENQWRIEPDKIKGIIIHTTSPNGRKPWDQKSCFYQEWYNNLYKADKINLKKIPMVADWSESEIERYSKFLSDKLFFWGPFDLLNWHLEQSYYNVIFFFEKRFPEFFRYFKSLKKKIKNKQ
jgi:lipopolysaccharide biosynthesis glycosyltransferase